MSGLFSIHRCNLRRVIPRRDDAGSTEEVAGPVVQANVACRVVDATVQMKVLNEAQSKASTTTFYFTTDFALDDTWCLEYNGAIYRVLSVTNSSNLNRLWLVAAVDTEGALPVDNGAA